VHPDLATLDANLLINAHRLGTCMVQLLGLHCEGCGRDAPPGHTAYVLEDDHHFNHLLCYECGRALADCMGLHGLGELPEVPAYGGGCHSRGA